jgi:hypothetical protein
VLWAPVGKRLDRFDQIEQRRIVSPQRVACDRVLELALVKSERS